MRTLRIVAVLLVAWALPARIVSTSAAPNPVAATCGLKPLKPIPPIGCRDLVAQCVIDGNGVASWQWVCVK